MSKRGNFIDMASYYTAFLLVKNEFADCTDERLEGWIRKGDIPAYLDDEKEHPVHKSVREGDPWLSRCFLFEKDEVVHAVDALSMKV